MKNKWKLVWSDDFEGSELDLKNWEYELGYIRNNELQKYTDEKENVYLNDSCLILEVKKTNDSNCPYTSGSIHTLGKQSFLYGRLEMRAKLPFGKGVWPAFWTLGINIDKVAWPACGEIDIMELVGGENANGGFDGDRTLYGEIHYPNEQKVWNTNACTLLDENYSDNFHIIGIEWDYNRIMWYVDGIVYHQKDISTLHEFHKEQYLILNLALGGAWPGDPDETTIFPQRYIIDWVRYYQQDE